ncbi:DNA double-strand break repair ATPase [uncultured virus]|nr:DNA double-strand break repair ATPase [uncultured virus]
MRILLKNFRAHLDCELEFKDGIIHFLKGDSGTGKSTIFQAIIWALYGKEQLVHNNDHPTQKMWVDIDMKGVFIHRQKYPGVLTVRFQGAEYQNDIAQSIINQQFGDHGVWTASSYLMQSKPHPFLEYSRKDRMKLLNHIAFSGEDPTPRIQKTDEKIKECEDALSSRSLSYEKDLAAFNAMLKEKKISLKDHLDASTIAGLEHGIKNLDKTIESSQSMIRELKVNVARYQTLKDQSTSFRDRLDRLASRHPELTSEKLEALKLQREKYLLDVKARNIAQDLVSQLDRLTAKLGTPPPVYQVKDLDLAKQHANKYQENASIAQSLKVSYTAEAIENEIKQLEVTLDAQWMFSIHRQAEQRRQTIQDLKRINHQLFPTPINHQDLEFMMRNLNSQWMFDVHSNVKRLTEMIDSLARDNQSLSPIPLGNEDLQLAEKTLEVQWIYKARRELDRKRKELDEKKLLLSKFQMGEDLKKVIDQLNHLRIVLRSQDIYQLIDRKDQLNSQLLSIHLDETVTPQILSSYQQELVDLERTKNLEHCPNCHVALSIVRGKVVEFRGHVYNQTEADELKGKIDQAVQMLDNQKHASHLRQQIRDLKTDVPDGIYRIVNLAEHEEKIRRCEMFLGIHKEILDLEAEIAKVQLPEIPEGYIEVLDLQSYNLHIDKCRKSIENLRLMDLYRQELRSTNLPMIPPGMFRIPDHLNYQQQIKKGQEFLQNLESIKLLEAEAEKNLVPEIPHGVLEVRNLEPIKRRLDDLKKLIVVSPPNISVEVISQSIEWHHCNEKCINGKVRELLMKPSEAEVTQLTIDDLAGALAQSTLLLQQISETEKLLDALQQSSSEMSTLMTHQINLEEAVTSREMMASKIEASKRASHAIEKHQDLTERCEQLDNLKQRLVDLQEFKGLCKEAECAALGKLIDSLNVFLHSVAYKLFDDPITIRISLFAMQKTKVRGMIVEKQHAHLDIHYKGGHFTDAKLLSGGEYERISLLLSLAFNRVVGSDLLILDEAMGSLDGERKDDCFETIRQCMANKTIIMTNHEGHVGYYDNIVELKS